MKNPAWLIGISITVLFSCLSACISNNKEADNSDDSFIGFLTSKKPDLSWDKIEHNISFEDKSRIILRLGRDDFYNRQLVVEGVKEDYVTHYHFIDLNTDGNLDVVYNGADGADADLFLIWINSGKSYDLIYSGCGSVEYRYIHDDSYSFWLHCPPYAGGGFGKIIEISTDGNRIESGKSYTYMVGIKFPDNFKNIFSFEIIKESFHIRLTPEIINEPCDQNPDDGKLYCGNQCLELSLGLNGQALSRFEDSKGSIWLFVVLQHKDGNHLGWIREDAVQTI